MQHHTAKPNICFIQVNALGLLVPEAGIPFGGAEVRAVTFAEMLQGSGNFCVSFAVLGPSVRAHSQTESRGMGVLQMPPHDFHPMIPNIDVQNFYSRTNADCFISLGANEVSHEMAEYGRILGVPTIVGIASDQSLRNTVFCGSMVLNEYRVPSYHAWEAMHQATSVLVQTQWQSDWLYRKAGRRGSLVPNPIPRGWEKHIPTRERHFTYDFLWVGRPTADKNPEIIFELARELGSARFRMVMDGGLAAIHERWRFNLPANILLTDRLGSQEELRALMGSSRAIINSSPMEGFPNLMLQGAMVGCPCIFLNVDPDGWGALHGCAASARGDVEAFLGLLAKVLRDPSWLDTMAARAFQRATERHSPEVVKDQLIDAVTQTLRQTKKARV